MSHQLFSPFESARVRESRVATVPVSPRLVAAAGLLKGSTRLLTETEISIGRDLSSGISIGDASVSRMHSILTKDGNSYRIRDLESLNGTFVNDLPVQERVLQHGDSVRIGTSLFYFLLEEPGRSSSEPGVHVDHGDIRLGSTMRLSPEAALYIDPRGLDAASIPADRIARDLSVLLQASKMMASSRSVEELAQRLLDIVLEVLPADRAAVLLTDDGSEELSLIAARESGVEVPGQFRVSHTVVSRVLKEKAAILSNEVLAEESLREAGSLISSQIRALVAVPLASLDRVRGVLYLDSKNPSVSFDEAQLQLLMGLANVTAASFENVRRVEWLEDERRRLGAEVQLQSDMVGECLGMKQACEMLARAAPTDATVLILGETGTGKELAARAIHRNSSRAGGPFVAVNCAALTETLLESDLFGHERGAFTGAIAQKKGKLEVADGGTVFLDEIGDLSPPIQAKLLRALEERQFERVGGTRPIRVDIRLVAATNKDLDEEVGAGRFRQDLYYRIHVVSVTMPPLRERREDIPLLASYFAARFSRKVKRQIVGFSPEARACLLRYDWPGNVRELSNAIERAVVLGGGEVIRPEDLPESVLETGKGSDASLPSYHEGLNESKRRLIREAVHAAAGNYTEAAKRLGLHANYLHRLIRNLKLKEELRK